MKGMNKNMDKLLDARDVMECLQISRAKAYQLFNGAEFPVIRIGKSIRVHAKDLEEWINKLKKQ